jgi:hypothetical protein
MKPPNSTFNQNKIDTIMTLSKNVIGKETEISRKLVKTRMNIDLLVNHPPILMPILALSRAPVIGAVVDIITNTEHVIDLLTPKDSS